MRSVSIRRLARLGVAGLTTTVLALGLGASPAFASLWQLSDGFEGDPSATWEFDVVGSGGGLFEMGLGTARTGSNNAFLRADTEFTALGRSVHVTPKEVHDDASCFLGFQVTPVPSAALPAIALMNVEVIDPSTWTYLAVQTTRISSDGWRMITSPNWTGGPVNVFARLSLVAGRGLAPVRVDDMIMQCTFQ
jgi:hypothetical protein